MTGPIQGYWTNPSVLRLAGNFDPIELVTEKAKGIVLKAVQDGWPGPPFDPFKLAKLLQITTVPREDVADARLLLTGSKQALVEFNPNKSKGRVRFSIAHEIAHTLFPDYAETVRNRGGLETQTRSDDWQIELLCNIAASEFLMPIGGELDSRTLVTTENIIRLQKQYEVSMEAISNRITRITANPCTTFIAARVTDAESLNSYRLDYCVPSRTSQVDLACGSIINNEVVSQCTAVGFTSKADHQRVGAYDNLYLDCIGIPPYPGYKYPRVIGIVSNNYGIATIQTNLRFVRGDALDPRGTGTKIIAQIVNDKTPNWGAGFARSVRNQYPIVQDQFKEWVDNNPELFTLGSVCLCQIKSDLLVACLVAQHGYGDSSKPRIRYEALKKCLTQLEAIALDKGASIHMPRIGTGYAGGNWAYIADVIDETLAKKGIQVTVYSLPNQELPVTQGALPLGESSLVS